MSVLSQFKGINILHMHYAYVAKALKSVGFIRQSVCMVTFLLVLDNDKSKIKNEKKLREGFVGRNNLKMPDNCKQALSCLLYGMFSHSAKMDRHT